jgi:hypothetical protein
VSLSCYQQTYTPGQGYYGLTGNNLPKATCAGASSSCFKMVCFGTTYYVIRGCLDFTQPQYNCQTLSTQCPGATGQCYTCNVSSSKHSLIKCILGKQLQRSHVTEFLKAYWTFVGSSARRLLFDGQKLNLHIWCNRLLSINKCPCLNSLVISKNFRNVF